MPSTPQSRAWLLARERRSKPRDFRSRATSGSATSAQSPGVRWGKPVKPRQSIAVFSKLPKAASAVRTISTIAANSGSTGRRGASGWEMMQSPTAARVKGSFVVIASSRSGGLLGSKRFGASCAPAAAPNAARVNPPVASQLPILGIRFFLLEPRIIPVESGVHRRSRMSLALRLGERHRRPPGIARVRRSMQGAAEGRVGSYRRRYTSVLEYFRPESTINVTTLAFGPRRFAT